MSGKDGKDKDAKADARKARVAAQLRRNLMRRKAQSRERAAADTGDTSAPAGERGDDGDA